MEKFLILGGGWVGARLAASDPGKYVVTKRTQAGVDTLTAMNLNGTYTFN